MGDLYLIHKVSGWLNTIFQLISCHFSDFFILTFKTIGYAWAPILAVTKHRQFIDQLSEQQLLK